jgi:flagellar protein FliO/FliZ
MHALTRMIGLILLGTYPAVLLAQTDSNPAAPPVYNAASVARQQTESAPLALKPQASDNFTKTGKQPGGLPTITTVIGSLAVVLGIFFLIVWVLRRASPNRLAVLPAEALEVLGHATLANHQQVHLLRCGNKLLLVSAAAAGGAANTLTEITDLVEVERLAGLCRQTRPSSPAATFRQVFRKVEDRHA